MPDDIRFMRLHMTENAAIAAALVDYAAFVAEFPDAAEHIRTIVLKELFQDRGLIGCILIVKLKSIVYYDKTIERIALYMRLWHHKALVEQEYAQRYLEMEEKNSHAG